MGNIASSVPLRSHIMNRRARHHLTWPQQVFVHRRAPHPPAGRGASVQCNRSHRREASGPDREQARVHSPYQSRAALVSRVPVCVRVLSDDTRIYTKLRGVVRGRTKPGAAAKPDCGGAPLAARRWIATLAFTSNLRKLRIAVCNHQDSRVTGRRRRGRHCPELVIYHATAALPPEEYNFG